MKKILSSLFFLLCLILIISLTIRLEVLEALDYETRNLLDVWTLDEEGFTVEYRHSVMLSPVSETYMIKDGEILLVESSFKDYGAGLPSSTPYKFEIDEENKVFRIYDINQIMDPLVYKVGTSRSNHKLIVQGQEIYFKNFSRERSSVEFRYRELNLLVYLLKKGGSKNG